MFTILEYFRFLCLFGFSAANFARFSAGAQVAGYGGAYTQTMNDLQQNMDGHVQEFDRLISQMEEQEYSTDEALDMVDQRSEDFFDQIILLTETLKDAKAEKALLDDENRYD